MNPYAKQIYIQDHVLYDFASVLQSSVLIFNHTDVDIRKKASHIDKERHSQAHLIKRKRWDTSKPRNHANTKKEHTHKTVEVKMVSTQLIYLYQKFPFGTDNSLSF